MNALQDTSGFQFVNVPFGLSFHAHICSVSNAGSPKRLGAALDVVAAARYFFSRFDSSVDELMLVDNLR